MSRAAGLLLLAACSAKPYQLALDTGPAAAGAASTPSSATSEPTPSDTPGDETADTALECVFDRCYGQCTDVRTDPSNCGDCGRTCVIPQAVAACHDGACAIGACQEGFEDADGLLDNGCEAVGAVCEPGISCPTACGTTGSWVCDGGDGRCAAPSEACNLADDDCDGSCEVGLPGCRGAVYRSHGPAGHIYGTDPAEASRLGQTVESPEYFFTYAAAIPGTIALFRCDKGAGTSFLTTSPVCEIGLPISLTVGYVAPGPTCGAVPLHRLYHPGSGNHFYTLSEAERDSVVATLGYLSEGIAAYVWTSR